MGAASCGDVYMCTRACVGLQPRVRVCTTQGAHLGWSSHFSHPGARARDPGSPLDMEARGWPRDLTEPPPCLLLQQMSCLPPASVKGWQPQPQKPFPPGHPSMVLCSGGGSQGPQKRLSLRPGSGSQTRVILAAPTNISCWPGFRGPWGTCLACRGTLACPRKLLLRCWLEGPMAPAPNQCLLDFLL